MGALHAEELDATFVSMCRCSMNHVWVLYSSCENLNDTDCIYVILIRVGKLHLNRQIVALMSGLGIQNEVFMNLQGAMLRKLADMLVKDRDAIEALHGCQVDHGNAYSSLN